MNCTTITLIFCIIRVSKKRAKLALGTIMSQVLAAQDVRYVGSADVLLLEGGSLGAEAGAEEGDEVAVGEVLTR